MDCLYCVLSNIQLWKEQSKLCRCSRHDCYAIPVSGDLHGHVMGYAASLVSEYAEVDGDGTVWLYAKDSKFSVNESTLSTAE